MGTFGQEGRKYRRRFEIGFGEVGGLFGHEWDRRNENQDRSRS